jgi:AMP-polyphosphate phosphotransferase
MLKDFKFPEKLGRKEYEALRDPLRERLTVLQQQAKIAGMGTVIIFEGWGAAGKGSRISDLVVGLDPRAYSVHTMNDPVGYENSQPFMTRYWSRLGPRGTMTIFDLAYYDELSRAYVEDVRLQGDPKLDPEQRHALARRAEERIHEHLKSVGAFERQLSADGWLIVRLFLHIDREMQAARLTNLLSEEASSWKVDPSDIKQLQHYDEYRDVYDRWLSMTGDDAWTIVPSEHKRNANICIMQAIADKMDAALRARGVDTSQPIPAGDEQPAAPAASAADDAPNEDAELSEKKRHKAELAAAKKRTGSADKLKSSFELVSVKTLDEVREKKHVMKSDEEYREELERQQARLSELSLQMYRHKLPLIVAYEGWDAAGKGGNIKRLTAAMDARDYRVNPIGAASKDELARPFLWRFWTKVPRAGHAAIFDRTWYGRVLVERIEGFAREDEWKRAFDEINEFEDDLRIWGAVLVKFWIDVSPDEQLRRFEERQNDPAKHWKITADDWRNREKNDLYFQCVNDMLRLTSTPYAPWHVIPSDDKRYARVKALKIVNDALEARL